MPAYGWNWQIYDTPENLGEYYRGTSHTYYAAKYWMQGVYNFTDDAPPQPFIPILSYWDDYDMGPWALPHVYDYMEGRDATAKTYPQMAEVYNRRNYLTAYAKQQKTEFGEILIDHDAEPDSYSGIVSVSKTLVTLGEDGSATYKFTIDEDGTYDVAVRLCYPFWDKNSIYASLDGSTVHFSENRLWWPYWRTTFWATLAKGANLTAGEHTLKISVGVNGVQFYGFRVCTDFSEEPTAGDAEYTLAPRKFKDINGDMVGPATGFKLTLEMLRRKPDSALVWYEDFRDEQKIPESYWTTLSGEWDVWQDPNSDANRPYSQLEGYGQLAWNYNGFSDIHLRAQIIIPPDGGGKSGVFLGSLFLCINYDTQRLELYEGSTTRHPMPRPQRQTSAPIQVFIPLRCVSVETRCGSIRPPRTRSASRLRSAVAVVTQVSARICLSTANCSVWGMPGHTNRMSVSMLSCRMALKLPTAELNGRTAPGMRSSRCSR